MEGRVEKSQIAEISGKVLSTHNERQRSFTKNERQRSFTKNERQRSFTKIR